MLIGFYYNKSNNSRPQGMKRRWRLHYGALQHHSLKGRDLGRRDELPAAAEFEEGILDVSSTTSPPRGHDNQPAP